MQYIDRDPEKLRREKLKVKMDEIDKREAKEAAERHQQMLEVARAKEERPRALPTVLERDEEDESARVAFNFGKGGSSGGGGGAGGANNVLAAAAAVAAKKSKPVERARPPAKRKSALDEIMEVGTRRV